MRVTNSHTLTIFQGVKIEVAVLMMEPNERGADDGRVGCVLGKKGTMCAHPSHNV